MHDLAYQRIGKIKSVKERNKQRRQSDLDLINCYGKHKNELGYTVSNFAMRSKISLENNFPPRIVNKVLGNLSSVQTK